MGVIQKRAPGWLGKITGKSKRSSGTSGDHYVDSDEGEVYAAVAPKELLIIIFNHAVKLFICEKNYIFILSQNSV